MYRYECRLLGDCGGGGVAACVWRLILMGRGDSLISGYNTASEKKRQRYNLFRLRLITGLMCIYCAIVLIIGYYVENEAFMAYAILPAAVLYMLLSYTWVRRK